MKRLRYSHGIATLILYSFVLAFSLTASAVSVSHAASHVAQLASRTRSAHMPSHNSSSGTGRGFSSNPQPAFSSAAADAIAAANSQHKRPVSPVTSERSPRLLSAVPSAKVHPSPSSSSPACAPTRRRILIAHEQHLRDMGSDQRLLSLVKSLVALGHEVSFFFRSSTPPQLRSPPTEVLARIIGVQRSSAHAETHVRAAETHVRADVRRAPPPAIYEYTSNEQLATLFAQGWFDAVLVFFWFWYDPKPNVAEILLPYVHAFSPKSKRPHITILSDDAHSLRDYRLAAWTSDPDLKAGYIASATKHAQRQRVCYMMADKLLHLTQQAARNCSNAERYDSEAEHGLFPFLPREKFGLLRLTPRAFLGAPDATTSDAAATSGNESQRAITAVTAAGAVPSGADAKPALQNDELRIGFLGHGGTPTNYLAVRWFLTECWPSLRQRLPGLRLRLVGEPPAGSGPQQPVGTGKSEAWPWGIAPSAMKTESEKGGQSAKAEHVNTGENGDQGDQSEKGGRAQRTIKEGGGSRGSTGSQASIGATASKGSWAAGTPFFGKEEANGIDVLSFLPTKTMSAELQSWRAMVVPILSTTGINTKVYLALRLGIPLVISTAAAAPFDFPPNSSAALLASSAAEFISQTHLVATSAHVRRNVAIGSATHWQTLLASDHSEDDVEAWVGGLCNTAAKSERNRMEDKFFSSASPRLHAPVTPFEIILRASNSSSSASTAAPLDLRESQHVNGSNPGATALKDATLSLLPPQACLRTESRDSGSRALPPPLIVLVHVISSGEKSFGKRIIGSIFNSVCDVCQLNCVLPIWAGSKTTAHVPYETQITLVMLGGRQVAAFDITGAGSRNMQARVMHIVVDADDYLVTKEEIDEKQQSWLGMAATQLILQSRTALEREVSVNRTALQLPLIRSECQERSVWRHALRFAGIQDQALQPIWRRLAKDLPNSFDAYEEETPTSALDSR